MSLIVDTQPSDLVFVRATGSLTKGKGVGKSCKICSLGWDGRVSAAAENNLGTVANFEREGRKINHKFACLKMLIQYIDISLQRLKK